MSSNSAAICQSVIVLRTQSTETHFIISFNRHIFFHLTPKHKMAKPFCGLKTLTGFGFQSTKVLPKSVATLS
jgi:hypothetical protein